MKHQPTLLISNACSELGQALVSDAAEHFRVALADGMGNSETNFVPTCTAMVEKRFSWIVFPAAPATVNGV